MEGMYPSVPYLKCSDEDLIRRSCAEPRDDDAWEELASRSVPRLEKTIRRMVYGKSSMCPTWYSRDEFFYSARDIAYEKFCKGIRLFAFKGSYDGWLGSIAASSAIEVRRKVIGRGQEPRPIPVPIDEITEQIPQKSGLNQDLAELVALLLKEHAKGTRRDQRSSEAIALRVHEDCEASEIAERLGTTAGSVDRLISDDYLKLRRLLQVRFGIASFDELPLGGNIAHGTATGS